MNCRPVTTEVRVSRAQWKAKKGSQQATLSTELDILGSRVAQKCSPPPMGITQANVWVSTGTVLTACVFLQSKKEERTIVDGQEETASRRRQQASPAPARVSTWWPLLSWGLAGNNGGMVPGQRSTASRRYRLTGYPDTHAHHQHLNGCLGKTPWSGVVPACLHQWLSVTETVLPKSKKCWRWGFFSHK